MLLPFGSAFSIPLLSSTATPAAEPPCRLPSFFEAQQTELECLIRSENIIDAHILAAKFASRAYG